MRQGSDENQRIAETSPKILDPTLGQKDLESWDPAAWITLNSMTQPLVCRLFGSNVDTCSGNHALHLNLKA